MSPGDTTTGTDAEYVPGLVSMKEPLELATLQVTALRAIGWPWESVWLTTISQNSTSDAFAGWQ